MSQGDATNYENGLLELLCKELDIAPPGAWALQTVSLLCAGHIGSLSSFCLYGFIFNAKDLIQVYWTGYLFYFIISLYTGAHCVC